MATRGRKEGTQDWVWVKISSLLKAGIGENFPIKCNRRWMKDIGLLNAEIEQLENIKTEELSETSTGKEEKIKFEIHEPTIEESAGQ